MLNHITIMGRLTRDPELKHTQSGTSVCSFSIACERDFKDKNTGEKQTDFIECTAWRTTAENISKYFSKGRMIVVSGRLQIRAWQDKDGNNRRSAEILVDQSYFGDSKPDGGTGGGYGGQSSGYGQASDHGNRGYSKPASGPVNADPPAEGWDELQDDSGELPF